MDNNVLCKITKIVNLSCVGETLCDEGENVENYKLETTIYCQFISTFSIANVLG